MSRQLARKTAFSLVYEYCITNEQNPDSLDYLTEENGLVNEHAEFCRTLYYGIIERFAELIELIERHSEGFSTERMFKVDLAILLIALYELKYMDDIPVKVSCNEAVENAKTYSTLKSPSFINGILASIVREIKATKE